MENLYRILVVSVIYFSGSNSAVNGALTSQEKISQSFYNKLNLATSDRVKSSADSRGNVQGLDHLYTWQNMFHAANDAFKIFKKFDKVKPKRTEKDSSLKRRKVQDRFQIKDFFNVRSEGDMIDEKSRYNNISLFKSFEAVPDLNREIEEEIKTTLRQILETTTESAPSLDTTTTTPILAEKDATSNPLIDFIYSLGSEHQKTKSMTNTTTTITTETITTTTITPTTTTTTTTAPATTTATSITNTNTMSATSEESPITTYPTTTTTRSPMASSKTGATSSTTYRTSTISPVSKMTTMTKLSTRQTVNTSKIEKLSTERPDLVNLIVKNVLEITKVNQEFKDNLASVAYIPYMKSQRTTSPKSVSSSTTISINTTAIDKTMTNTTPVPTSPVDSPYAPKERQISQQRRYSSKFRDFHNLQFYFPNVLSIFY